MILHQGQMPSSARRGSAELALRNDAKVPLRDPAAGEATAVEQDEIVVVVVVVVIVILRVTIRRY